MKVLITTVFLAIFSVTGLSSTAQAKIIDLHLVKENVIKNDLIVRNESFTVDIKVKKLKSGKYRLTLRDSNRHKKFSERSKRTKVKNNRKIVTFKFTKNLRRYVVKVRLNKKNRIKAVTTREIDKGYFKVTFKG